MFFAGSLSGTSEEGFAGSGLRARPVTVTSPSDLALRSFRSVLQIVRHEAAVDEDETGVAGSGGKFQRRIDEEARPAFPGREEMALAVVVERASRGDRRVVDVAGRFVTRLDFGEGDRRRMRARLDGREQVLFPVQTLYLPGTEREQCNEGEGAEKRDKPRKAAVRQVPRALLICRAGPLRPCWRIAA